MAANQRKRRPSGQRPAPNQARGTRRPPQQAGTRRPPQKSGKKRLSQSKENKRKRRRFYTITLLLLIAIILIIVFAVRGGNGGKEKNETAVTTTKTVSLAPVKSGDKWGYIDDTGKLVINYKFASAGDFSENGFAVVQNTAGNWGYIKADGTWAISPTFQTDSTTGGAPIGGFSKVKLAPARSGDGLYGFIDEKGSFKIAAQYTAVRNFNDEGIAAVRNQNGLWGYIDKDGNTILDFQYADAGDFGENDLAPVMKTLGSFYGYIDKTGKEVIQPQFMEAYPFRNGVAAVLNSSGIVKYIDKTGLPKFTKSYISLTSGHTTNTKFLGSFATNGLCPATDGTGNYGYIDLTGAFKVDQTFYRADNFSDNGLAAIQTKEYKWGFINSDGKTVITPQYDDVGSFTTVTYTVT